MKITTVIYKERLWESVASDAITFLFLTLCIWFSNNQGGGWWTFFTTCLFLMALASKMTVASSRIVKIKTKQEAINWAKNLADNEDTI